MGIEESESDKPMANNNNEEEEQVNPKDPESNLDHPSHKRLLPFSLEIDRFKNKYMRRSLHSVICIAFFVIVVLINIIGIELFFSLFEDNSAAKPKFEIHPTPNDKNLIHIKKYDSDEMVNDVRIYLSPRKFGCESNDNFYCFVQKELDSSQCSEMRSFGLKYGSPCLLVDLKPVADRLNSNVTGDNSRIHLKCDGVSDVDKELVGPIEYYPRNGVPVNYLKSEPFVFVHLVRPTYGVAFAVQCNVFWESQKEMVVSDQSFQFEALIDV